MKLAIAVLVALGIATGCGHAPPPYECGEIMVGDDVVCIYGDDCADGTVAVDNGELDVNGVPVFACTDSRGRAVTDCVVRDESGTAAGLCRAETAP